MREMTQHAVYNSQIPTFTMPLSIRNPGAGFVRLVVFVLVAVASVRATDWTQPGRDLVRKIEAVTGPGAISLQLNNRSSLNQTDVDAIRRGISAAMTDSGMRLTGEDQAAASVEIVLSESHRAYVWVATIREGASEPAVVMVSLPRPETALPVDESNLMIVHKSLLWSQADPILDAAVIDVSPARLLILDPNQVTSFRLQDSKWVREQTWPIAHQKPWPRDLRGRLLLRKDHLFDAYLPGVLCRSTPGERGMTCNESDDPWPVGTGPYTVNAFFASTRNFFTGALAAEGGKAITAPAFYSIAVVPRDRYVLRVVAATNGSVHLLDGMNDQTLAAVGWGSDVASIKSKCGSGWQVLATQRGDRSPDSVTAFELPDREPAAASSPAAIDGKITALWTETAGNTVMAVSRNAQTGRYEAYRLSMVCGQ